ncbi:MAG: hypothetical protein R3E67_00595 [Pseudomonadales bacterium]
MNEKHHTMFARRYAFICYCSLLLLLAVLLAEIVLLPRLFGMPRACCCSALPQHPTP